jgi:hypothetical protein
LRAYAEDWFETFDSVAIEPLELIKTGWARVVGMSGRARLSGIETELIHAIVCTIRQRRLARARGTWTRAAVLEAVGLSE